MKKSQPHWMESLSSKDCYHFLAWRKLADCYGILFDENLLETFVGRSSEEILDTLLESTNIFLTDAEKCRAIAEKNNYYCDYSGTH